MHITRKTDQPLYIGFYIIDVVCEHTFPIDYIKFCLMSATGIKETKLLMIKKWWLHNNSIVHCWKTGCYNSEWGTFLAIILSACEV